MQINAVCVERQWMISEYQQKMFRFLPCFLFGGDDDDASLQCRIQFPQQYLLHAHLFQIEKLINIYETFELI